MSYIFVFAGALGSILLWALILYREFRVTAAKKAKDAAAKRQRFARADEKQGTATVKLRRDRGFGHR